MKLRVLDIARAARSKARPSREKLNRAYSQLLCSTSRVVGQAMRFAQDIAAGVKRAGNVSKQLALEGLRAEIERMVPLVRQVMKRVCIPNRATKSAERQREQKKRSFRNGQKWRTGCEGRISVAKRRHGLNRCRTKGDAGMRRWVGLGVIADTLINIGRALHQQVVSAAP